MRRENEINQLHSIHRHILTMSHMLKLFRDKPERLGDTDVVYIYQRLNVVLAR